MINNCAIKKSLHYKPNKIIVNRLNNIDSISNVVGNKKINIFEYIIYNDNNEKNIMIGKWKSRNIIKNGAIMLSDSNFKSLLTIIMHHKVLGYNNSYCRESYIYSHIDDSLKNNFIEMYGTYTNKLLGKNFILLKKFGENSNINKENLYSIIDGIINIHAFYYNNDNIVDIMKLNNYSSKDYAKCSNTLEVIFDACNENNIRDYGMNTYNLLKKFIKNISIEYSKYEYHKTLTHNDFSNRNIYCNHKDIYFYDWELACYQNPEHDLIDILICNLNILDDENIIKIIKYYKNKLYAKIETKFKGKEYRDLLLYNVKEYMVNKLSMLRVYNKNNHMKFIDELTINSNRLLNILLKEKKGMKTILIMYITLMPVILTGILNMIFCKINILNKLNKPLDFNMVLKDGKRLFGNNKTIKGFIGYLLIGSIVTIIWGLICNHFKLDNYFYINHNNTIIFNSILGLLLGFTYSVCELPNSFIKRRFGVKEGKNSNKLIFFLYDQFDSIIGCCLIVAIFYKMSFSFYIFYVFLGGITHVIVNMILYLLRIRKNMF